MPLSRLHYSSIKIFTNDCPRRPTSMILFLSFFLFFHFFFSQRYESSLLVNSVDKVSSFVDSVASSRTKISSSQEAHRCS